MMVSIVTCILFVPPSDRRRSGRPRPEDACRLNFPHVTRHSDTHGDGGDLVLGLHKPKEQFRFILRLGKKQFLPLINRKDHCWRFVFFIAVGAQWRRRIRERTQMRPEPFGAGADGYPQVGTRRFNFSGRERPFKGKEQTNTKQGVL